MMAQILVLEKIKLLLTQEKNKKRTENSEKV